MTMNRILAGAICALVVALAMVSPPGYCTDCEHCGIQSLLNLSGLVGVELRAEQRAHLTQVYGAAEISMVDIKQAAQTIGISLQGVRADIEELGKLPGPKVLHLRNPDHFAVLAAYRPGLAQLVDSTGVTIVPGKQLQERYTGYALMVMSADQPHAPRLRLSDFAFDVGMSIAAPCVPPAAAWWVPPFRDSGSLRAVIDDHCFFGV